MFLKGNILIVNYFGQQWSDTLKKIEEKALELPEKERALLAEHLITSLEKNI